MKTSKLAAASLLLSLCLLALQLGVQLASAKREQSNTAATRTDAPTTPALLQPGKVYLFNLNVGATETTSPLVIKGRVEKVEANMGWVYVQHYVETRKGKVLEGRFGGYGWINLQHVYHLTETTTTPSP